MLPGDTSRHEPVLPFLKWPGGKRWIADLVATLIREKLAGTYFEPFLGGGAVFFALRPGRAVLSDTNEDLINTYRVVREDPTAVITRLKKLEVSEASYYRVRATQPSDRVARAARFLYLNRTAFGGIYRLNLRGEFNVPYGGGGRTPAVLWETSVLTYASAALKSAKLHSADFEDALRHACRGDVVYCDPTYSVAHDHNGFVRYNERNFSWADQLRLAEAATRAVARGASVILSNAYNRSIRELYPNARVQTVERRSAVSPNPKKRRLVKEYLILV